MLCKALNVVRNMYMHFVCMVVNLGLLIKLIFVHRNQWKMTFIFVDVKFTRATCLLYRLHSWVNKRLYYAHFTPSIIKRVHSYFLQPTSLRCFQYSRAGSRTHTTTQIPPGGKQLPRIGITSESVDSQIGIGQEQLYWEVWVLGCCSLSYQDA